MCSVVGKRENFNTEKRKDRNINFNFVNGTIPLKMSTLK